MGRRRAKTTPKGREVQPKAKNEVAILLGERPHARVFLIKYLHLIPDAGKRVTSLLQLRKTNVESAPVRLAFGRLGPVGLAGSLPSALRHYSSGSVVNNNG